MKITRQENCVKIDGEGTLLLTKNPAAIYVVDDDIIDPPQVDIKNMSFWQTTPRLRSWWAATKFIFNT